MRWCAWLLAALCWLGATAAPAALLAQPAETASNATRPSAVDLAEAERILDLTDAPDPAESSGDARSQDERAEGPAAFVADFSFALSVLSRGGVPQSQLRFSEPTLRLSDLAPVDPNRDRCEAAAPGVDGRWLVEQSLCPTDTETYVAAMAALFGEWSITSWLQLRFLVDTGEIRDGGTLDPPLRGITLDGRPPSELGEVAFFVRELALSVQNDTLSLEVGRFRGNVADGLILDDFLGFGLRGRLHLQLPNGNPLHVELMLAGLQRSLESPNGSVMSLRIDYDFSPFEWLGGFAALVGDDGGGLSDAVRSAFAEGAIHELSAMPYDPGTAQASRIQQMLDTAFLNDESQGGALYVGGQLSLLPLPGLSLRMTAALMAGRLEVAAPRVDLAAVAGASDATETELVEVELGGSAIDIELHYGLSPRWDLGAHLFRLSGDAPPGQTGDRYRAFLAPAPFWVWSGLFFSGGLSQGFYPSRASSAGINGRGALGMGASVTYDDGHRSVRLAALWLRATADPPAAPGAGTGRNYGLETDLELQWRLTRYLRLGAELDVLLPGDYFHFSDVAYRALALATFSHGS